MNTINIVTAEDLAEFIEMVDKADFWSDVEPEAWNSAYEFTGVDPEDYGDIDQIFEAIRNAYHNAC